ncbi:MAG: aminotransferase class I/II-fold pyridoxal phosphate-dependent enzyme [Microbacteriaceae bacterium]
MKAVAPAVEERTPRGIAAAISRMITAGDLAPGDRLPTVRDLAAELGVSPATVSHAWQTLASAGLITSRGRSGSFVQSPVREWMPRRYQGLDGHLAGRIDLSRGTPDPDLLPSLGPTLGRLSPRADTSSYQQKPDIPELHDLLRATWPGLVESLTVTNGALDAIDRVFATMVRYGDRVAVETPTFPPFIDLLEQYGLEPVGIELDAEGPRPASFTAALARQPALVLLQPRAQNPTGISTSAERAGELAGILSRSRVAGNAVVVEDDHSGPISHAPDVSLARWLPDRVLRVRSYSKSHGPDLRIGALGGPRTLIDRVVSRRLLGPGWTSRMTQTILYDLLTNPQSIAEVDAARDTYAARQRALSTALARHGVTLPARDGINAWMPVADERSAIVSLAGSGILVAPGSPFQLRDAVMTDHVRVTVGMLRDDDDRDAVAAALALASTAS